MTTVTETGAERNVPANIGTQAVVHIGDGVTLTRTGAEFDPSLPFEQWEGIGKKLRQLEGAVLWWWGDWLIYGEKRYPDRYSQALEATDYSYQTLQNATWVAKQFPISIRLETVPWSLHQAVAAQDPEVAQALLDTAQAEGWTRKELQAAVRDLGVQEHMARNIGRTEATSAGMHSRAFDTALDAASVAVDSDWRVFSGSGVQCLSSVEVFGGEWAVAACFGDS